MGVNGERGRVAPGNEGSVTAAAGTDASVNDVPVDDAAGNAAAGDGEAAAAAPEAVPRRLGRGPEVLAAAWGFAEATLFFLVPDVLLTWLALSLPRRALRACYWALGGTLIGAVTMIAWTGASPGGTEAALVALPGISTELLEEVRGELVRDGLPAILTGPVQGIPYKTYVVEATILGFSAWKLVAVSVPARLFRFLLLTLLAIGLARGPLRRVPNRTLRILHVCAWTVFYLAYFTFFP